jgi:hypothetical protein
MLRIHINSAAGTYTIPPNNPFVGVTGARAEIWAFGLRNPFRNSFDRQAGRMFIGDVGQSSREEIDVQQPTNPSSSENYGWRVRKGSNQNPAFPGEPTPPGAVNPIFDYPRSIGRTVIGGYVYRGQRIRNLRGVYVFGDLAGPGLGAGHRLNIHSELQRRHCFKLPEHYRAAFSDEGRRLTLGNLSSLGEDANGELYITDISNGSVFKIVAPPLEGDFNGDSNADILWQHTSGTRAIWLMNGTTYASSVNLGAVAIS